MTILNTSILKRTTAHVKGQSTQQLFELFSFIVKLKIKHFQYLLLPMIFTLTNKDADTEAIISFLLLYFIYMHFIQ